MYISLLYALLGCSTQGIASRPRVATGTSIYQRIQHIMTGRYFQNFTDYMKDVKVWQAASIQKFLLLSSHRNVRLIWMKFWGKESLSQLSKVLDVNGYAFSTLRLLYMRMGITPESLPLLVE